LALRLTPHESRYILDRQIQRTRDELHTEAAYERLKQSSVQFHHARLRHSGVESAIGAMRRGNGLKRCSNRSNVGFANYFAFAILVRNIHTLGKLLLTKHHSQAAAAVSKRA